VPASIRAFRREKKPPTTWPAADRWRSRTTRLMAPLMRIAAAAAQSVVNGVSRSRTSQTATKMAIRSKVYRRTARACTDTPLPYARQPDRLPDVHRSAGDLL
jgi:hypothetical protein